jgi:hypothetical protein
MKETRNAYRILVVKPLGEQRRLWDGNLVDLWEIGCKDKRWMKVAWNCVK